jgi:hypothetical protein
MASAIDEEELTTSIFGRILNIVERRTLDAYLKLHWQHTQHFRDKSTVIGLSYEPKVNQNALVNLIQAIRATPDETKQDIISKVFNVVTVSAVQQTMIVRSALRLLAMVDVEAMQFDDVRNLYWNDRESYAKFLKRAFPYQLGESRELVSALKHVSKMSAWSLYKHCNITCKATDNLAHHLLYDASEKVLYVFLHTGFLETVLSFAVDDLDIDGTLNEGYNLPRQLSMEVLVTTSMILFPVGDAKSYDILEKLAENTPRVDVQCLTGSKTMYEIDRAGDFEYHYFANRICDLHQLVLHPPPANALMAWVQNHTSERNVLWIAILGLFISAFFGLLGFITGVIGCVFAWKQLQQGANPGH